MSVESTTDYWEARKNPARFAALVRSRAAERAPAGRGSPAERVVDLEEELDRRERRVAELREIVARRTDVEELVAGLPGYTTWSPSPTPPRPPKVEAAAGSRRTSTHPWSVEFRPDARPRHTIRLSYEGVRTIEQHIEAAAPLGVETGGLGWTWNPGGISSREAIVDYVTGPPASSRHARNWVNIGNEAAHRREFPEFIDPDGMRLVLDWHSHPTGNPQPSTIDRDAWAGYLYRNDRGCRFETAGLVATPGRDGDGAALGIQLHGWWTHRVGPGVYAVVPANVVQSRY